jgi:hypothetical protein
LSLEVVVDAESGGGCGWGCVVVVVVMRSGGGGWWSVVCVSKLFRERKN